MSPVIFDTETRTMKAVRIALALVLAGCAVETAAPQNERTLFVELRVANDAAQRTALEAAQKDVGLESVRWFVIKSVDEERSEDPSVIYVRGQCTVADPCPGGRTWEEMRARFRTTLTGGTYTAPAPSTKAMARASGASADLPPADEVPPVEHCHNLMWQDQTVTICDNCSAQCAVLVEVSTPPSAGCCELTTTALMCCP